MISLCAVVPRHATWPPGPGRSVKKHASPAQTPTSAAAAIERAAATVSQKRAPAGRPPARTEGIWSTVAFVEVEAVAVSVAIV